MALLLRRRVERGPPERVVHMPGYAEDDIVRRGILEAGAAFVQKPFCNSSLASAIRASLAE